MFAEFCRKRESRDSERNDFCLERNQFRKPIVMEIFERFKNRLDGGSHFKLSDLIKGIKFIRLDGLKEAFDL
jgi:hypothetical protein